MTHNIIDLDLELARKLQEEYDKEAAVQLTENDEFSKTKSVDKTASWSTSNGPRTSPILGLSPVDPSLELTDPNPNIHELFLQFNAEYFWGRLSGVEVRWSPRMTLCAGLCVYEGRGGLCSVRLSQPLLKLRPRKDLVETLLHEMIHAFLFVTDNDRDHDGHGPNFQKHMHRINKATGANISIYHTFHAEVAVHQQHWWRCGGPCQKRGPYFGYVKRAMNRAPSAQDFWWAEHQATCGGTYTKIREPEGYEQKKGGKGKNKGDKSGQSQVSNMDIRSFIGKGNKLGTATEWNHKGGDKKLPDRDRSRTGIGREKPDNRESGKKSINKTSTTGSQKSVVVGGVLVRKGSSATPSPLFSSVNSTSDSIASGTGSSGSFQKTSSLVPNRDTSNNPVAYEKSSTSTCETQNSTVSNFKLSSALTNTNPKTFTDYNTPISHNNKFLDDTDEWSDDEDDLLLQNSDVEQSTSVNDYLSDDVIDLTDDDFMSERPADRIKNGIKHLKNKTKSNIKDIHGDRTSSVAKTLTSIDIMGKTKSNDRKKGHEFPKNFVSVCEGGDFSNSILDAFKKDRKKKRYIMDELDSNDGLWDENSSDHSNKSTAQSFGENTNDRISSQQEGTVGSREYNSSKTERVPQVKDADLGFSNAHGESKPHEMENEVRPKQRWRVADDTDQRQRVTTAVGTDRTNPELFIGQGHRLGYGEEGQTFLAKMRKTQQLKVNHGSEHENFRGATYERSDSMSSQTEISGKKRKSDEAFGEGGSDFSDNDSMNKRQKDSHSHSQQDNNRTDPEIRNGGDTFAEDRGNTLIGEIVSCPVCSTRVLAVDINNHLDQCLLSS